MPDEAYKNFVLFALAAYWPAALFMVKTWKIGKHRSFSHHAAGERRAYYLFAVAITVETTCYSLFLFRWFIPYFGMSPFFQFLVVLTLVGHLVSGLVPETTGWKERTHWLAAYGVAWLFMPITLLLVTQSTISTPARIVALAALITQVTLFLQLKFRPKIRERFLIYQALYILTLPLVLVAATYLS